MVKNKEKVKEESGRRMRKREESITGGIITHRRIPRRPLMMRLLS